MSFCAVQAAEGGAAGVPGRPDSAIEKLVQVSIVGRCWQRHSARPVLGACIRHGTARLQQRTCHSLTCHVTPPQHMLCTGAQAPCTAGTGATEGRDCCRAAGQHTHSPGSKRLLNTYAWQPAMWREQSPTMCVETYVCVSCCCCYCRAGADGGCHRQHAAVRGAAGAGKHWSRNP